jgi:hypothetical protein
MQKKYSHPQATRAMRPWSLLFFLVYAVQKTANHFEGIAKYPVRKFLKSPEAEGGLGLSPEKAGAFLTDTALGWYIKALFGLLTDNLPLFGYRRKSWLIIASLLCGFAWFWVAMHGTTVQTLLVGLVIVNVLIAFSDVVCDGLMVETAQRFEHVYGLPVGTGNRPLQAAQWSGAMVAVFVASIGGGIIAQFFTLRTAAMVSGIAPLLLTIAVAVIVKEEKVAWDWRRANKGWLAIGVIIVVAYAILWLRDIAVDNPFKPFVSIISSLLIIGCLLAMVRIPRRLTAPVILVFLWQATPFDTNAQFVYHYFTRHNHEFVAALAQGNTLTDALRDFVAWLGVAEAKDMSSNAFVELYWGSVIGTVNALFAVVGALFFRRYLQTIPFARLFAACIAAQGMVIFCFLSFSLIRIASPDWLMGLMATEGFVFMIATLAVLGYAAKCTPEDNQASIFAFFMGMYNLGQILGREQVGSRIYTVVAEGSAEAAIPGAPALIQQPHMGMSVTVVLALLWLSLIYALVHYMIRRGYIVTHAEDTQHRF